MTVTPPKTTVARDALRGAGTLVSKAPPPSKPATSNTSETPPPRPKLKMAPA